MGRCEAGNHNVNNSVLTRRLIAEAFILPYRIHCLKHSHEDENIQANSTRKVCNTCWMAINREVKAPFMNKIMLKVPNQEINNCVVCGNPNPLYQILFKGRINFYLKTDMFIYSGRKCCLSHVNPLDESFKIDPALLQLQGNIKLVEMTIEETSKWFEALQKAASQKPKYDICKYIRELEDGAFKDVVGIAKCNFNELCEITTDFRHQRLRCKPLSIMLLLLKLRHSQFLNFLKALFGFNSKGAVSSQIKVARLALMAAFVPKHLGPQAHNRPECLQHLNRLSKVLHFENPDNNENAILMIDGTYVYISKSYNYTVLKRTYSIHKGRHLVKMTMVVFPNGRIMDVHGPYLSDGKNNDASTLQHNLEKNISGLRDWLLPGDVVVVDRGYRDCVDFLNTLGIDVEIPFSLSNKMKQHTCQEANYNRVVTKSRWIVESRNGHIKQIFKFFDRTIHAGNVPFIGDYFRIACAIINAYRPTVTLSARSENVGDKMEELRHKNNHLMEYLMEQDLLNNRRKLIWRKIEDEELEDFPKLTLEDLYDLTLGVYQIKQAGSYMKEKHTRDKTGPASNTQVENEDLTSYYQVYKEESDLLRARIYSRHSNATMHNVYIRFFSNKNGKDSIKGWYCTCKCGSRTLGMCAHICAILWYLCFARYEPEFQQPKDDLLDVTLDAAERTASVEEEQHDE